MSAEEMTGAERVAELVKAARRRGRTPARTLENSSAAIAADLDRLAAIDAAPAAPLSWDTINRWLDAGGGKAELEARRALALALENSSAAIAADLDRLDALDAARANRCGVETSDAGYPTMCRRTRGHEGGHDDGVIVWRDEEVNK